MKFTPGWFFGTVFTLLLSACAPALPSLNGKPINEIPMYGRVEKNAELRKSDEKFVQRSLQSGPRDSVATYLAGRGWQYLGSGDGAGAIKRFNQCWLVDSTNGNCYWGFGAYVGQLGYSDSAIGYWETAHALMPDNPSLEIDLALAYAAAADRNQKDSILATTYQQKSNAIFEKVARSGYQDEKLYCVWARVKGYRGDVAGACELMKHCTRDLDGLNAEFGCR